VARGTKDVANRWATFEVSIARGQAANVSCARAKSSGGSSSRAWPTRELTLLSDSPLSSASLAPSFLVFRFLPFPGAILHEGRHLDSIDSISAREFQDAINRLQHKAAREGSSSSSSSSPAPPPPPLLVPIDRITGSRGGSIGLNYIPQRGSGVDRLGGGEVEQDDGGVWVPRRDDSTRRSRPPGRARLAPVADAHDWVMPA